MRRNRFRLLLSEPPDPLTADGHPSRGSSGLASPSASPPSSPQSKAARREEAKAALAVLAGLAEHDSCVPLMIESGDLGCLFQVSFKPRLFISGVDFECGMRYVDGEKGCPSPPPPPSGDGNVFRSVLWVWICFYGQQ